MTRVLCMADTQIGVGTVSLADQRDVLDRIVKVALDRDVSLVVHGGDVFEGPVVTPEHLRLVLDGTEQLRKNSIPILILRGNGRHDMAVRSVHALDVLRDVPGFAVSDRPDVNVFDGVTVCTLPWVHPGRMLARMNGSIDHDKVNDAVTEILVDAARTLHDLAAENGNPTMLVAHWAISGAKLPSGLSVDQMREPILPYADLDAFGYDIIVGAHIHESQVLSNPEVDNGPGFVIGSPQQLNFGESGEHGCWIVDFDEEPSFTFVPIESRQFLTIDVSEDEKWMLAEHVVWSPPPGAIVRVRTTLTEQEFQGFDQNAVRRALLEAGAAFVRFDIDVQREARTRVEISEQLSAVEAMALYCDAAGIEDPLRAKLLEGIREWSSE